MFTTVQNLCLHLFCAYLFSLLENSICLREICVARVDDEGFEKMHLMKSPTEISSSLTLILKLF